jgi:hypothetical protein
MIYAAVIMSLFGAACGLLLWAGCANNPNVPPLIKGLAIAGVLALAISNVVLATARMPKQNTRKKKERNDGARSKRHA